MLPGAGHMPPRYHPAKPQARRDSLGERTAVNHIIRTIEGLGRLWPVPGVMEIAIDIVLDKRYGSGRQHGDQLFLTIVGHLRTHGIAVIGHHHTGFQGPLLKRQLQALQAQPLGRVGRNLNNLEPYHLQRLENPREGRGFHGHNITRLGHGTKRQDDRFLGTVGGEYIIRRYRYSECRHPLGNLPPKRFLAGKGIVECFQASSCGPERAVLDLPKRQVIRMGNRCRQRHHPLLLVGTKVQGHFPGADWHRTAAVPSHHRLGCIHRRQPYEVATALPGLQKASCFQGLVRLQDSRNTYAILPAQHSHARQSITVTVDTVPDQLLKLIRHLIVKNAHPTPLV